MIRSNSSFLIIIHLVLIFCSTAVTAEQKVRPLDWSKLEGGVGEDELGAMCKTVLEHTQNGMGKAWLEKIESARRVGELLDFGYIEPSRKKGRRRAMEDCIRPITTSSRTLILAIKTDQYREEIAGAPAAKIKELLPLVIRSVAKDHMINGGIGKDTWGNTWQSAMWAGNLGQVAWIIWDELSLEDRILVTNLLVYESDRFLGTTPPTSDEKSVTDTKGEENLWNSTCLLTASTMLLDHPHEQAWLELAITYFLNAVATPHDLNSHQMVDGKPLSERLNGYCITEDYAVGNHGVYPHPSYTSSSYLNTRGLFFCALADVKPPEALFYNAAPIYRMFIDHQWSAPPHAAPGGTIYKADGGIYWPIEKETERAGRYYKWFNQDIMAATYGFDEKCSTKGRDWALQHGQLIVDAFTGKPIPVELESYHKGAFFKTALSCYIIRVLHVNNQGHLKSPRQIQ